MARPELLDLAEAAAYLRRPRKWVADEARAGRIPGRKAGRRWLFTDDDLAAYLDSIRTGGDRIKRRRAS